MRYLINTLIICLFCLTVWTGCGRQNKGNLQIQSNICRVRLQMLEDSLGMNPARTMAQLDSLMWQIKDSTLYYEALLIKAKAKMLMSEPDSVDWLIRKVEEFCRTNSDSTDKCVLWINIYNMRGNLLAHDACIFDSAQMCFKKAYDLCDSLGYRKKQFDISQNLADAYSRDGHYDKGAYWYRHSLALADSLDIPEQERFSIYYGLAQMEMSLQNFEQCDYYFDLAGRYYNQMMPYQKHIYLNNRGNSYYYREDYVTALGYFRRLLAFTKQHPEMEMERNMTMVNLADVFLSLNETDSAAYYLNRCQPFFRRSENSSALYYIDTQLIELALKEHNLPLAQKRLREAVKPEYVEPNMQGIRNRYLQDYYYKVGDYRMAYHYLCENMRINDSTRNEYVKMKVAEIALRYQQDTTLIKKEMQIQQTKSKVMQLNQRIYVGGLLILLLLAIIAAWLFYDRRKRAEADWEMRSAITSLRLGNIRNRISPHFIFNILSRELQVRNMDENTNLMALIKLIRRNLELTDSLSVKLEDEIDFVKTYVDLEKRVLGPDFEFRMEIGSDVILSVVRVPAMLLQIPVENAMKHALFDKPGHKLLEIIISKEEGGVKLLVRDNGGGFRAGSSHRGTGSGLKVITQTIQLLNSYNSRSITMAIENIGLPDGESGCEIRFSIPDRYSYVIGRTKNVNIWTRCIKWLSSTMKKVRLII